MNIYESLKNIQSNLKAPKNQRNKFGNYNYRSAEDILEAVKPLCHKYDTALTVSDEMILLGDRYYIKATATLNDFTGNKVEVSALAREPEAQKGMNAAQITGSASSYARKYALNGLFNIDDTKDPDATNKHGKEPKAPNKENKTDQAQNAILKGKLVIDKQLDLPANLPYKDEVIKSVCAIYEWKSWDNLTFKDNAGFTKLLSIFNQELEKEKALAQAGI